MGFDFKTKHVQNPQNLIKQRALDSINQTESDADVEKQEAQKNYDAAKAQYEQLQAQMNSIYSQLKSDRNNSDLKKKYTQLTSSVFDAQIGWEVARDHLQGSLSYYSKMNTTAFFANKILG